VPTTAGFHEGLWLHKGVGPVYTVSHDAGVMGGGNTYQRGPEKRGLWGGERRKLGVSRLTTHHNWGGRKGGERSAEAVSGRPHQIKRRTWPEALP